MKVLRGIRRACSFLWRYSLVLTVPASLVFLFWAFNVGKRYYDFGIRYGDNVGNPDLFEGMLYEAKRIKSAARIAMFEESPKDDQDSIPQVHLLINKGQEGILNSHLPSSGREYKEGYLYYPDGQIREVDMRYRGDFAWHWATHKKSWRVKTSRDAMWNNMRAFNLVIPKGMAVLEDALGYWLAKEMNLISPEADLVEVIINGKSRGIHTQVEQLEELVLRKNDRMPGDLFGGELIGRDAHEGIVNWVFDHPGTWEKIAINNHYDPDARESLTLLCDLLAAPPSEDNLKQLRGILDIDAFGRFAAFRVLTQTKHFDRTHNWRLYYDPWKCQFEPVIWDTVPWHKDWMPRPHTQPYREPLFSRLDDRLALDHQYRIASDVALRDFFHGGLSDRLMTKFDALVEKSASALRRDPVLNFKLNYVSPEKVTEYQQLLRSNITKLFNRLREDHLELAPISRVAAVESEAGSHTWRLALYGRRSLSGIRLELQEPLQGTPEVTVRYRASGQDFEVDVSGLCSVRGRELDIHLPLIGGMAYKANPDSKNFADRGSMLLQTGSFDIELKTGNVNSLRPLRMLAMLADGEVQGITQADSLPVFELSGQYGVTPELPSSEVEVWEGEVVLTGQRILKGSLQIRPGTTVYLDPLASLVVEGKVLATGTKDRPIQFLPRDFEAGPWGTFAIRGPQADGSVFQHVHFRKGGGWKQPLAEFSSMFSVHWVQNVVVEDCIFADSQVIGEYLVDDMVHGVYSDIVFERCQFLRSYADALDMDISKLVLRGCTFEDSGNDSIDLMTSTAIVEDTQFLRSFDKGISIGENSTLFARNCFFDSCEIALQSKDDSQAAVVNCDIYRCVWGVDAYKKNWRYNGGGEIYVYKSRMFKNELPLRADKYSTVGVADTYIDNRHQTWEDYFLVGPGMRMKPITPTGMRPGKSYRFKREEQVLGSLGTLCWSRVNNDVRGSTFMQVP